MRFCLEMWGNDLRRVEAAARLAEALGIDGVYYGESPTGLNLDCWTVLARLSAVTERMRLGPVLANILPDYRSLVVLAKQAATVAIASVFDDASAFATASTVATSPVAARSSLAALAAEL